METPAVDPKLNAAYVQCSNSTVTCPEQKEAKFSLYLHRIGDGPNVNQIGSVNLTGHLGWGSIAINDWAIRDGADPGSKLIARAQGMQAQCGKDNQVWYNSYNIVFVDDSFRGSTLEVRGSLDGSPSDMCAVVGGTGQFTLAQGLVKNGKVVGGDGKLTGTITELFIRIVYRPFVI